MRNTSLFGHSELKVIIVIFSITATLLMSKANMDSKMIGSFIEYKG